MAGTEPKQSFCLLLPWTPQESSVETEGPDVIIAVVHQKGQSNEIIIRTLKTEITVPWFTVGPSMHSKLLGT